MSVTFKTNTSISNLGPSQTEPIDGSSSYVNYEEADYTSVTVHNGVDSRWKQWGLEKNMKLTRLAADFYLLYDLNIEEQDNGLFGQLMNWILPQFRNYTDMAVGGELRHGPSHINHKAPVSTTLRKAWSNGTIPSNRHAAWHNWKFFRNMNGTIALKWAEDAFKMFSGNQYGGPPWANIANVLWMYESGQLTPISFVDTCFGLEHNGGAYFNKAWNTDYLKTILDLNLHGHYEKMYPYASPSIRELHANIDGLTDNVS